MVVHVSVCLVHWLVVVSVSVCIEWLSLVCRLGVSVHLEWFSFVHWLCSLLCNLLAPNLVAVLSAASSLKNQELFGSQLIGHLY